MKKKASRFSAHRAAVVARRRAAAVVARILKQEGMVMSGRLNGAGVARHGVAGWRAVTAVEGLSLSDFRAVMSRSRYTHAEYRERWAGWGDGIESGCGSFGSSGGFFLGGMVELSNDLIFARFVEWASGAPVGDVNGFGWPGGAVDYEVLGDGFIRSFCPDGSCGLLRLGAGGAVEVVVDVIEGF